MKLEQGYLEQKKSLEEEFMVRAFCNDLYKVSHSAMMFRDMNNLNTMADEIAIYVSGAIPLMFSHM